MLVIFCAALAAPPPFPARADFVRAWLELDPQVQAAQTSAEAARAAVGPSPVAPLRLDLGAAPLSFGAMAPGVEVGASWMLPAPRMRALAARQSTATAQMQAADAAMVRQSVAAAASQLVDEVWAIAGERALLGHHDAVLGEAAAAVARRVAAGLATPDQAVMAEMSRVSLAEERLDLDARAARVAARLSGLATSEAPALAALLAWSRAESAPPDDPGPVRAGAGATAPEVVAARAEAEEAEAMAAMAARSGAPMTELMLRYSTMWGDPMMAAMVGVAVDVPLDRAAFVRRQAAAAARVRAADLGVLAAERVQGANTAEAEAELAQMAAMEALMSEKMAPLAAEARRLARTAYETNRGSLMAWLEAEKAEVDTSMRWVEARASRRQMEAMVAMNAGLTAGLPEDAR